MTSDKHRDRHHIGSIAHHFLGESESVSAFPTRILMVGLTADSLSARVGAALIALWRREACGGSLLRPRGGSGECAVLEIAGVLRSVETFLGQPAGRPPDAPPREGLELGHLGLLQNEYLTNREVSAAAGEPGVLGRTRWPDLTVVARRLPDRLGAVKVGRLVRLVGAKRLTLMVATDFDVHPDPQPFLVSRIADVYGTVAAALGTACRLVMCDFPGPGGVRGELHAALVTILQDALAPE